MSNIDDVCRIIGDARKEYLAQQVALREAYKKLTRAVALLPVGTELKYVLKGKTLIVFNRGLKEDGTLSLGMTNEEAVKWIMKRIPSFDHTLLKDIRLPERGSKWRELP